MRVLDLFGSRLDHELFLLQDAALVGQDEIPQLVDGESVAGVQLNQIPYYALKNLGVSLVLAPHSPFVSERLLNESLLAIVIDSREIFKNTS